LCERRWEGERKKGKGKQTWIYNCENVMYHPFAIPISSLPAYKPPILVVVIMTIFATQQSTLAIQRHCLLPSLVAKTPANEELRKAPSVINEEMSCWRSVEMLYPVGTVGSAWPKISRKPRMACRPPMAPKSMPYWKGDMETRVHAARHFQLERRLEVRSGMVAVV
jgi:hypothetical protein